MGWDKHRNGTTKGNLSTYGRDRHMRSGMSGEGGKNSGDGSEGAPQTYVQLMVELSYDKPRPDPDGALRRECGAAIRRAVEGRLTGDALAAQLGDARVTLRAMVMRQEDSLDDIRSAVPGFKHLDEDDEELPPNAGSAM